MAVQSALSKIGAGKQSGKGSAGTLTYAHGLSDGAVMTVDVQQALEDRTSGSRVAPAVNRTAIMSGVEFTSRAHAASSGLWLYAALGSISTTGSGTYTHVMTVGSDTPYLTTFGSLAANYYSVQDVKVGDLSLSWDGNEPLSMGVTGMGTVLGFPGSFSPTTDDSHATYMRPVGGTFQIDVDSSTPATANVVSGEVSIANSLSEVLLSGTITPNDIVLGRTEVECSFDIIPDNLNDWRSIVTGGPSGTSESGTPVYGSFSCQFTDGTNTLTVASSRVAFTVDFPASDPAGGPVTLSLAGLCVQPAAGGTPVTVTLVNSTASY